MVKTRGVRDDNDIRAPISTNNVNFLRYHITNF